MNGKKSHINAFALWLIASLPMAFCLVFPANCASGEYCIVNVKNDGTIYKVTQDKEEILSKINDIIGIGQANISGRELFSRNLLGEVYAIDLVTGVTSIDQSLSESLAGYEKYKFMRMYHAGVNRILFTYDASSGVDHCELDLTHKTISKLPIINNNHHLSFHDDLIYFSDQKGIISYIKSGVVYDIGIYGGYPVVSPDGYMIAYVTKGMIVNQLVVYNLITKENKVFSTNIFDNILDLVRWSSDGRYVAFQTESFFERSKSIEIYDVNTGTRVKEIDGSKSVNWFFADCRLLEK